MPGPDELRDPTRWVTGLFERLLGRAGTQEELATFVRTLEGPDCDPKTVLYALLSSAEYHRY